MNVLIISITIETPPRIIISLLILVPEVRYAWIVIMMAATEEINNKPNNIRLNVIILFVAGSTESNINCPMSISSYIFSENSPKPSNPSPNPLIVGEERVSNCMPLTLIVMFSGPSVIQANGFAIFINWLGKKKQINVRMAPIPAIPTHKFRELVLETGCCDGIDARWEFTWGFCMDKLAPQFLQKCAFMWLTAWHVGQIISCDIGVACGAFPIG